MNRFASVILALLACAAWAQSQPEATPASREAAYQRIEAERQRAMAVWDAQEAQCAERFAVNDCLKKVSSGRRAQMAALKREEAVLRETEREERGALQLQRIAQHAQEKHDAQKPAEGPIELERLQAQQEKQAEHAARLQAGAAKMSVNKAEPQGPTAREQASNRTEYQRKLAEAEKRRQDVARRKAEKTSKSPVPLPTPP